VVPLDFLAVRALDTYAFERMAVSAAAGSDFLLVNLFRGRIGAPVRPGAIGDLLAAASRRGGPGGGRDAASAAARLREQRRRCRVRHRRGR